MSDVTVPVPGWSAPPDDVATADRFTLLGRIGAGNHGVVFRARDRQLGREVAIKRFTHLLADDPRAMRRITREVETLARVSHPHVVTVHDLVHMPDGDGEVTPHLVMELVEGTSLRDLLTTHGPSTRSVVVVRGVLQGLAACHRADILHLDIKPANVLVTPSGGVKIVDFGIARAASDATATIAGTPHYMAPEQYDGRADERSDVYSVGCLLYECLTGRAPFAGTMAAQLLAHRTQPRPDPRALAPEVGPRLAAVVTTAMAIDPADRYASVDQMLEALTAAADDVDHSRAPLPAPAPEVEPEAEAEVVQAHGGPAVTRWTRLTTFSLGLLLSAVLVAVLPVVAWGSLELVPGDHRPQAMDDLAADAWWMVAGGLAIVFLLLRRRDYFGRLAGPQAGAPLPDGPIAPGTMSGVRMAAWAAVRGSLPLLFPWYALGVTALAATAGLARPDALYGSTWTVAWVVAPLAVLVLTLRGLALVRLRVGALLLATLHLGLAVAAAAYFVAAGSLF